MRNIESLGEEYWVFGWGILSLWVRNIGWGVFRCFGKEYWVFWGGILSLWVRNIGCFGEEYGVFGWAILGLQWGIFSLWVRNIGCFGEEYWVFGWGILSLWVRKKGVLVRNIESLGEEYWVFWWGILSLGEEYWVFRWGILSLWVRNIESFGEEYWLFHEVIVCVLSGWEKKWFYGCVCHLPGRWSILEWRSPWRTPPPDVLFFVIKVWWNDLRSFVAFACCRAHTFWRWGSAVTVCKTKKRNDLMIFVWVDICICGVIPRGDGRSPLLWLHPFSVAWCSVCAERNGSAKSSFLTSKRISFSDSCTFLLLGMTRRHFPSQVLFQTFLYIWSHHARDWMSQWRLFEMLKVVRLFYLHVLKPSVPLGLIQELLFGFLHWLMAMPEKPIASFSSPVCWLWVAHEISQTGLYR